MGWHHHAACARCCGYWSWHCLMFPVGQQQRLSTALLSHKQQVLPFVAEHGSAYALHCHEFLWQCGCVLAMLPCVPHHSVPFATGGFAGLIFAAIRLHGHAADGQSVPKFPIVESASPIESKAESVRRINRFAARKM